VDLLNDQLLHALDRVLVFEAEVELGGANRFIRRVVPDLKVGMVQGLLTSNSLRGIEVEHPGQEIDRERVGMGDKGGERDSRFDGERTDVLLGTGRTNTTKSILRRSSQVVQDLVELINITEKVSAFHITGILMYPYSLPLKIGFPRSSSARMHPTDQTSMAVD
jgi:hypothetical protein